MHSIADKEALARMFAAETGKRDAWPYMAVAVTNAADARGISIEEHLKRPSGTWGHNSDGHWASTCWERADQRTKDDALAYADKFLTGRTEVPKDSEGIRSFFEVDERGVKHDPGPFLRKNPELELAIEVDGWQFYRRHGKPSKGAPKSTIIPNVPDSATSGIGIAVAILIAVLLSRGA